MADADVGPVTQIYAEGQQRAVEHILDQVSASLDRIRADVVGGMERQRDGVVSRGEGLVSQMETKLSLLTDRRAALEAQAISQDHIGFLKVRAEPPSTCGGR